MPFGAFMGGGILLNDGGEIAFDKETDDSKQIRFQALHHQFIASAKAVKLGHEINKDFKIGCMIAYMTTYPYTCNPEDVFLAQERDNLNNFLCSDVQVRGAYPGFAKRFFRENNIEIKMEEDDEKILKEGCIDFYTFSYYMSNCSSTDSNLEKTSGNILGGVKNPYLKASDWG